MNDAQRAELKEHIRREIDTLRANIVNMADSTGPVEPDVAIGRISRLDTMMNQGINEAAVAKAKLRILKLEAALVRIDEDPDFGECAECGEPIGTARLLALPESELCVQCAE